MGSHVNSFRPLGYHLVNYNFALNGSLVAMEGENVLICIFSPFLSAAFSNYDVDQEVV